MSADRMDTDGQGICNLLARSSLMDELKYLQFSVRQYIFVLWVQFLHFPGHGVDNNAFVGKMGCQRSVQAQGKANTVAGGLGDVEHPV